MIIKGKAIWPPYLHVQATSFSQGSSNYFHLTAIFFQTITVLVAIPRGEVQPQLLSRVVKDCEEFTETEPGATFMQSNSQGELHRETRNPVSAL